jgi:hypothetical protein
MDTTNDNNRLSHSDGSANLKQNGQFQNAKYNSEEPEQKRDDQFPGYPHYPANEDITKQMERVPADMEKLAPPGSRANQVKKADEITTSSQDTVEDDVNIVLGTEADVTREDLRILNATEGAYAETTHSSTLTGDDLDVPGADVDDPNEDIGEEDEENNYYSLGGDNHENLEEDQGEF